MKGIGFCFCIKKGGKVRIYFCFCFLFMRVFRRRVLRVNYIIVVG